MFHRQALTAFPLILVSVLATGATAHAQDTAIGATFTTPQVADDQSGGDRMTAFPNSPARQFSPMTPSGRLRN